MEYIQLGTCYLKTSESLGESGASASSCLEVAPMIDNINKNL